MSRSLVQKSLLLTAVFTYILAGNFLPLWAARNYQEIILPTRPVFDMKKPGLLLNEAPTHIPKIQIKSRLEGLERVRILEFEFPKIGALSSSGKDRLMAVYILDKDGLVVGHHDMKSTEPHFRILINSVINYIQVYVECHKHGLWFEEFYIRS